jgi:quercetin dioxygenase-like cupin family protein
VDPKAPPLDQPVPIAGQILRVLGDLVTVRAVGADTGGAYALFETCTPAGAGMPPHLQRYEDEALFVIEGMFAVLVGDRTVELGPGGYLFVPRGTAHAYTNVGPGPGRLLMLVSPGGIHELFLAEVGAPVAGRAARARTLEPPDIARIAIRAEKYGVELLSGAPG